MSDQDWRRFGDAFYAQFEAAFPADSEIRKAGEIAACFAAGKGFTRLLAGMLAAESSFGSRFNANPASNKNALNLRPRGGKPGFMAFPTWAAGVAEWKARITDPTYAYRATQTLDELVSIYAPSEDHNAVPVYVSIVAHWITQLSPAPPEKDQPMTAKPTILINAGHRNTTGGDPEEASLTPAMARAYRDAFRNAGYAVVYLEDNANDWFDGNLDDVGRRWLQLAQAAPGVVVGLDVHYEGEAAGVNGVFVIPPDNRGLIANAPNGDPPDDAWANNPLDVQLARQIARNLASATGLPLRTIGVTEPGVMSERLTGVGLEGYRLAMFGWTAPVRGKMVRLVVEHGNHYGSIDRPIIFRDDFTDKCAPAVVRAVDAVFGAQPAPQPTPEPAPAPQPKPTPKPKEPVPGIPLPKGLTVEMLMRLYTGSPDNKTVVAGETVSFSPHGEVSRAWLTRGIASIPKGKTWREGSFPQIKDRVRRGKDGKDGIDWIFANGSAIHQDPPTSGA